jgi:hypothetical protein
MHSSLSLLGFPFTGLNVFVGRPGYRIDSRTIKRGLGWVTWSHRLRELNPLHTLLLHTLLLIGISLCEVLGLVVSFPPSPSSLKTDFICISFCVFGFGGFTGSFPWEALTSPYLIFLPLTNYFALCGSLDRSFSYLFKKPKFAKNGVRMQKLWPFSSSEFFSWCKSGEHRDFHREADAAWCW